MSFELQKTFEQRQQDQAFFDLIRQTVESVGGQWLGVQVSMFPDVMARIEFRNPVTRRDLFVTFNPQSRNIECLADLVKKCLDNDSGPLNDPRVSVRVDALQDISKDFQAAYKECLEVGKFLFDLNQKIQALTAGRKS